MGITRSEHDPQEDKEPLAGLYVVGTPIGNLGDLSRRAVEVLASIDHIVAEDTRVTAKLLTSIGGVRAKKHSFYGKGSVASELVIEWIKGGESVALVSDAGMPGISDPGLEMVAHARAAGVEVMVIPGPSALTAAVALCDFDVSNFVFAGFLPTKVAQRRDRLTVLREMDLPLVIYEAPHRIVELLEDCIEVFGETHRALLCRELTKRFEESYSEGFADLSERFEVNTPRGEFTLVISKGDRSPIQVTSDLDVLAQTLGNEGVSTRAGAAVLQSFFGISRNRAYEAMVERSRTTPSHPRTQKSSHDDI